MVQRPWRSWRGNRHPEGQRGQGPRLSPGKRLNRVLEPGFHRLYFVNGFAIFGFQSLGLAVGEDVGDQMDLMPRVVEGEQP